MKYREEFNDSLKTREEYVEGINKVIKMRQADMRSSRREYAKNILTDAEKYREDFKRMLGWPLVDHVKEEMPEPSCTFLSKEDGYDVYRMTFKILEGLNLTGILLKKHGNGKRPLVICQHGGDGTPETITGVHGDNTYNYNRMVQRVMKGDVHTFSPQLLLWSNRYGAPYDRKALDVMLKNVGSSITALEIYGLSCILDYFERQDYVSIFGMVGLSYGGFYTLFTTAIDTRIKSAISSAFFNSREANSYWSDWTWTDCLSKFNDPEIACLVYPRKLYISVADNDNLFKDKYARESFETIKEICSEVGTDWIDFEVFEGVHEFSKADNQIDALLDDLK